MALDAVSQLGEEVANISSEQDNVKENLSPDEADNQDVVFAQESSTNLLTGTIIKKIIAIDSFVLDHPVYGDIDSTILKLDGGYTGASETIFTF